MHRRDTTLSLGPQTMGQEIFCAILRPRSMHSQPKAQKEVEDLRAIRAATETPTSELWLEGEGSMSQMRGWARAGQPTI